MRMSSQMAPHDEASHVRDLVVESLPVRVHIRGSGPTLVLLGGIGGHVAMWNPLAQQLERSRTLIMFDAPGAGMTPPMRRPPRMHTLAAFVTQVLDDLAIRDF